MIDLISDTVTQPTLEMRKAMANAEVGDDVYGEDRTVRRLEELSAHMLGKPASCLMPSGTMANLTSIMSHCPRGSELLLGNESDLYNYEAGGVSIVGGVVLHPVITQENGELSLVELHDSIRDPLDSQCSPAGAISIENPHVRLGGVPLSVGYLATLHNFSSSVRLPLHMDGARIFNAAIALETTAAVLASHADSIQFCLSKSLAAPIGSVVVGSTEFIERVRRHRKMLGGGMRQAGVIAAAGIVALTQMIERLHEDHHRARQFHDLLQQIEEVELLSSTVATNMFFFRLRGMVHRHAEFLAAWETHGVRAAELGKGQIRVVTHYQIQECDILSAVKSLKLILARSFFNSEEVRHVRSL